MKSKDTKVIPHELNQKRHEDRVILATFVNVDFQRVRFWCLTAAIAAKVPKRLGPDATRAELAADRKKSRKICNHYWALWRLFRMNHAVPEPPVRNDWPTTANDPLMARIGATVIWETQVDYLISVVARRMYEMEQYYVVAVEDGMTSWFNKYETLLDSEFDSLHQINDSSEGEAQRLQIKREILEKRNAQSRAENRRWGGWGGWENYPKL